METRDVDTDLAGDAGPRDVTAPPPDRHEEMPALLSGPLAALRGLMERPLASYYLLLASAGLLLVIGLVMVFSATSVQAYATSGNAYASVSRQLVYAAIGLIAFWLAHRLPVGVYRAMANPLMWTSIGLLVVQDGLDAIGKPHLGPLRVDNLWLYFGPIQVQPSELGKLALALWAAGVLVRLGRKEKRFADLSRTLFPLAGLMLVLVGYNDFGTMICMLILFAGVMFAAGVQMRVFGTLSGIATAGMIALIIAQPYRVKRITGFLHPEKHCPVDITGDPCYQALEGRYAIANGGWFGVGLGQGHLKWGRLPNAHNDFIFAVIAEELGVFGCFIVIALLAVLTYTGLRIARRVDDPFRRIVATGIIAWLVGQATINIGGVIGLLPITGLPLPFISDGGSALVVVLGAVGVLASFARAEPDAARALHQRPPDKWLRLLWAPLPPLPPEEPERFDDDPDDLHDRPPRRRGSPFARAAEPVRAERRSRDAAPRVGRGDATRQNGPRRSDPAERRRRRGDTDG